jgi:hypothetical protein
MLRRVFSSDVRGAWIRVAIVVGLGTLIALPLV